MTRIAVVVEDADWRELGSNFVRDLRRAARIAAAQTSPLPGPRPDLPRKRGRKAIAALRPLSSPACGGGVTRNARDGGGKSSTDRRDLTILLSDDAKLAALNAQFRGKPKPTNVLSFPAGDEGYLGDVAIAYGTAAREARAAAKSIHDHAIHLTVHGVLHLLGYDHETAREARIMEPLEIAILSELGIANPYAARVVVPD